MTLAPVDAVDIPDSGAPARGADEPLGPADPSVSTPYLQLDVGRALTSYRSSRWPSGPRAVHYAVKANPEPSLVAALVEAGSRFDVAGPGELELCLAVGADPARVVYSNPVKRRARHRRGPSARRRRVRGRLGRRDRQAGPGRPRGRGAAPAGHQRRRLRLAAVREVRLRRGGAGSAGPAGGRAGPGPGRDRLPRGLPAARPAALGGPDRHRRSRVRGAGRAGHPAPVPRHRGWAAGRPRGRAPGAGPLRRHHPPEPGPALRAPPAGADRGAGPGRGRRRRHRGQRGPRGDLAGRSALGVSGRRGVHRSGRDDRGVHPLPAPHRPRRECVRTGRAGRPDLRQRGRAVRADPGAAAAGVERRGTGSGSCPPGRTPPATPRSASTGSPRCRP